MATLAKNRGVYVEVGCILFVGLIVLFFELFATASHLGFFCDDDSIRYPLLKQTITTTTLVLVSFITPIIVFLLVEALRVFESSTPRDSWHSVSSNLCKSLLEMFGAFIFGAGLNQVTVDVAKYTVGRLRPHFLEACRPFSDPCSSSASSFVYVTDYKCTGDPATIEEARLSFPSGHAALAFYTAVYLSIFLQHRLWWRGLRLPRHILQATLLMLAWFTSLSRVHDNMHHSTDVAAGILIGTVWAILMATFVIDLKLDSTNVTKEELRNLRTNNHIQGLNSV